MKTKYTLVLDENELTYLQQVIKGNRELPGEEILVFGIQRQLDLCKLACALPKQEDGK